MAACRRDDELPSQLGPRIRRWRAARDLTQRQLAGLAGMSLGVLRDLEQGRTRHPRWATVAELLAVLEAGQRQDAGPGELLYGDGWAAVPADGGERPAGRPGQRAHIGVLGPLVVGLHGQAGRCGRPAMGPVRQRAVLGLLALCHGSPVHRDAIIDVLWGGEPPASAVAEVQRYVCRLRKLLGPDGAGDHRAAGPIVTAGAGYLLEAAPGTLDLAAFGALSHRAEAALASGDAVAASLLGERALGLWRGGVLSDVDLLADHPAVAELERRHTEAVIRHAEAAAAIGAHGRSLPALRMLCAGEPFNERAHLRLMLALAVTGQQAAAVQVFTELRRRLDQELGILPSPQLALAYEKVLRQEIFTVALLRPAIACRPGAGGYCGR